MANFYEQLRSAKIVDLIAKGRAAAKLDDRSPTSSDWMAQFEQIHQLVWRCMGSLPVCTESELMQAIQTCLTSPHLRDDRAAAWLMQHCQDQYLGQYNDCVLYTLGVSMVGARVDGARWALEVEGENHAKWCIQMVEIPWSWKDSSCVSLLVGATGVSKSEFARLSPEIADVARSVREVLDRTTDIVSNRDVANDCQPEELIPDLRRQREEDDESIRRCLELWLLPPAKSDQLQRRLRNAIGLMTQAAKATHSAVAISLWCAAIEAMVVKKGSDAGIAEAFTSNTTTLLQPTAESRLPAMKEVKKLYAARSDLIHGNTIEENPGLLWDARGLAAGVFRAMMQWMREHDTIEQRMSADDALFDALRVADKTGRAMVGVSPLLESCLPGYSAWRKEPG